MTMIAMFLKELDQEAVSTRKMLSIVPADKFNWQPHPKSMTVLRLATHIAELPSWVGLALTTSELDFGVGDYQPATINTTADLLNLLEKNLEDAKTHLLAATEDQLEESWTLRNGDTIYSTTPKSETIRHAYCQIVHHRAQLGVFLRLLDIPIPGCYGPSADEMGLY
ncbi:DinB family protein [Arcicella aquatica]|uniref:DinB family protein n=1 Tax=Arcicella aquatica TaxID=217141 RepID=A0ABU5QPV6_9BACT|nr:DinB family protein [Arcicella aquatica]MEA5259117.1 DinB family protein [Arcicella aquatica]